MYGKILIGALLLASSLECIALTPEDSLIMRDVVEYLVPKRGCRRVEGQGACRPALIDTVDVNGDTNRLARVLAELAHTNDAWYAEMAMWQLEKYGTSEQLQFLYSCTTNPAVGDRALKSIFAIEGVTSNSVVAAESYLMLTNEEVCVDRGGATIAAALVKYASQEGVDANCRTNALAVANTFATTSNRNYYWLDHLLMQDDASYRYSKRRLQVLRSADILHCPCPYQVNFVTNAINELVAYPEADLPD